MCALHTMRGADRSALPNVIDVRPIIPRTERGAGEVGATNTTSSRHRIPLPDAANRAQATALFDYTHAGGGNENPRLRRPRGLTPSENCAIASTVNQNVRMRSGCESQRGEARALRMRLWYHTPDFPFVRSERFGDGPIRLKTLGFAYLSLVGIMGGMQRGNIYTPECRYCEMFIVIPDTCAIGKNTKARMGHTRI